MPTDLNDINTHPFIELTLQQQVKMPEAMSLY